MGGVVLALGRMPHHPMLGTFSITIGGVDRGAAGYQDLHLSAAPFSL